MYTPQSSRNIAETMRSKLLVAEDNPINREVMFEMLDQLGYQADFAENGRQACEMFLGSAYAAVLMDCQMPEMDGYEAVAELRKHQENGRRTPVIAVTAHTEPSELEQALRAGMDDYLVKPVSLASLEQMLKRWIADEPARASASEPGLGEAQSAAGRTSSEPPLDPNVSRSLAVISLVLRHVPKQIEAIATAVEGGDASQRKSTAHKLKGSCIAVGAAPMAALCSSIEKGEADPKSRVQDLRNEFQRVKAALERECAEAETSQSV